MRKWIRTVAAGAAMVTVLGMGATNASAGTGELRPSGKGFMTRGDAAAQAEARGANKPTRTTSNNGISYHGGRLMTSATTITVVPVYYGQNWGVATDTNDNQALATGFLQNLGGSPYFNINTTYYDGAGRRVPNAITVATPYSAPLDHGTQLSDADVQSVIAGAVANGAGGVANGPNTLYAFMGSDDVYLTSGFGTQYCGWHTHATIAGQDTAYLAALVVAPQWYSACSAQTTSPNGAVGTDAMISVLAHEVEEIATDVDLNAWYDTRGYENADKCAWTFGTTSTAGNGSKYNVTLGGVQYLIQRNWVNASGGYCSMSY